MFVQISGDDLVGDPGNQLRLPLGQAPVAAVDQRCGLLDVPIGVIDGFGHAVVSDGEVDERALGLGAPVAVGGYLD